MRATTLNVASAPHEDEQTVGAIAEKLALESSTLTPLLKRLEGAELVHRTRNPDNERQVVVALTSEGRALRERAGCLGGALLAAPGQTSGALARLNRDVRRLSNRFYDHIGGWKPPV